MDGVEEDTYDYHYIVGTNLGFPEQSVDVYSQMRVLEEQTGVYPEEEERSKIGVEWAGFYFTFFSFQSDLLFQRLNLEG
ncbi:hypothetical protein [Hazenella coriacea]|uniref:Uncharacterized protein n=1 Tax=Hazenella coriacea TaxID=1179467 RepID=A0A4R3L9Q6_9BACL|nr:hypothetical protein [Hazenella coriacea]TCS96821.1 hypothetical protein EDD58_101463 [Hazenella coriacea]